MYKGNTLYKRVSFVNGIKYKGLTLSCVKSEQSNMPHDTPSDTPELDQCSFYYLTNARVDAQTVLRVEHVGRSRWSIEDGFNHSKNRGSDTKHKYARKSDVASHLYLQTIYIAEFFDNIITHCTWFLKRFTRKWDITFIFDQLLSNLGSATLPLDYASLKIPKQLEFPE
jgi:hypothetical protein